MQENLKGYDKYYEKSTFIGSLLSSGGSGKGKDTQNGIANLIGLKSPRIQENR